jgi:hypothetical protein
VSALYDIDLSEHPPLPVILWRDVFVLVDKGDAKVSDYPILERILLNQSEKYPGGLGCLVIIPSNANPPPDDVRQAIKDVLTRLGPRLRCLCWLVEGTGFRAAAVRATLTGLRMFSRPAYPTAVVANNMNSAVTWILTHLASGRTGDAPKAVETIERARPRRHSSAPLESRV